MFSDSFSAYAASIPTQKISLLLARGDSVAILGNKKAAPKGGF
jgi:hypothetical protein